MRLFHTAVLAGTALALSACATRGSIRVDCPEFAKADSKIVFELPQSQLVREIQQEALFVTPKLAGAADDKSESIADDDKLAAAIAEAIAQRLAEKFTPTSTQERTSKALLLSGGGQWGSFGAGFLHQLYADQGSDALDYDMITGVSTGGLQSIFVAVGDEVVSAKEEERFARFVAARGETGLARTDGKVRYIDLLLMNYSPVAERDIVNRNSEWLAVKTGSFAGLKPLKKRIEAALCENGDPALGCPLIDKLARSKKAVFIGFVRADDGKFIIADAVGLAKLSRKDGPDSYTEARNCLTGAALASAAMPVTFQQVRVEQRTYLDGGVRQSVFDASALKGLKTALERYAERTDAPSIPSELNVIRNGPTALINTEDTLTINRKGDAISAAKRAQAIVVNELEVGSIASLRLERVDGPIRLVTADGYKGGVAGWQRICTKKNEKAMFDPQFMTCLREFGRFKAGRKLGDPPSPWLNLSEIGTPPADDGAAAQGGGQ